MQPTQYAALGMRMVILYKAGGKALSLKLRGLEDLLEEAAFISHDLGFNQDHIWNSEAAETEWHRSQIFFL